MYPETTVVCTDAGQHRQVVLGLLTDYRTTTPAGRIATGGRTAHLSRRGKQVVQDRPSLVSTARPDGGFTYTMRCPRPGCSRNVQLRDENLGALLDRLYAASPPDRRRHRWDISRG
jgi:hypothetical protein